MRIAREKIHICNNACICTILSYLLQIFPFNTYCYLVLKYYILNIKMVLSVQMYILFCIIITGIFNTLKFYILKR